MISKKYSIFFLFSFVFQSLFIFSQEEYWSLNQLETYRNEFPELYALYRYNLHPILVAALYNYIKSKSSPQGSMWETFRNYQSPEQQRQIDIDYQQQHILDRQLSSCNRSYMDAKHFVNPHVAAYEILYKNEYRLRTFATFRFAHDCIQNINNADPIVRLYSRSKILEIKLPPPYDKALHKSLENFIKHALDSSGQIKSNLPDIPIEKTFKNFFKVAPNDFREFYLDLPIIDGYEHKSTPYPPRLWTSQTKVWVEIIEKQHQLSYKEFTDKYYHKCSHSVFKEIYNFLTTERFKNPKTQAKLKRDPLWNQLTEAQRNQPEYQSQLLLRAEYAELLQQQFSFSIQDFVYDMIDQQPDLYNIQTNNKDKLEEDLLTVACVGMNKARPTAKKHLFHKSGILKKLMDDPFMQYLEDHTINDSKLQYAINYAMTMRNKHINPGIEHLCHEIINNVSLALTFESDKEYSKIYADEASKLVQELKNNQNIQFDLPPMNQERLRDFNSVEINKHLTPERYKAYEQTQAENFRKFTVKHEITPDAKAFMQEHNIDQNLYSELTVNGFQHELTEELIQIMGKAFKFADKCYEKIACLAGIGQYYNLAKRYTQSVISIDACLNNLKYHEAIALGLFDGAERVVEHVANIINHPVQFIVNSAKGMAQLFKFALESPVGDPIDFILNLNDPENNPAPITPRDKIEAIANQLKNKIMNASGPQRVRMIGGFITEQFLLRKALTGLHKTSSVLYKYMTNKEGLTLYEILNPHLTKVTIHDATGELVATYYEELQPASTPNQIIKYETPWRKEIAPVKDSLQITALKKNISGTPPTNKPLITPQKETPRSNKPKTLDPASQIPKESSTELTVPDLTAKMPKKLKLKEAAKLCEYMREKIPNYYEHLIETERLQRLEGDKMRMAGGRMQRVISHIKHENGCRIKITNNGKIRIDGLHNLPDIQPLLDEGLLKMEILEKKQDFLLVEFTLPGQDPFDKTISTLTIEETVAKKFEAFENYKIIRKDKKKDNVYIAEGLTKEGIKFEFVILKTDLTNNIVEIITSYISRPWIEGTK